MDIDERDQVAQKFGVAPEQVERDHLISHLLGFLGGRFGDRIHLIGGTALARTHLSSGRLSEDIDLIAVDSRKIIAEEFDDALPFGPTNRAPSDYIFKSPPSDAAWQTQLARQTRLAVTAAEALAIVRGAWARVIGDK